MELHDRIVKELDQPKSLAAWENAKIKTIF